MSLATDLTQCQARLAEAGQKASAELRRLKGIAPASIYNELMLHLCEVAAGANDLKVYLGSLRMLGELEQRPPPVTAESLELAECCGLKSALPVPMLPTHAIKDASAAFRRELEHIGDDTFADDVEDTDTTQRVPTTERRGS